MDSFVDKIKVIKNSNKGNQLGPVYNFEFGSDSMHLVAMQRAKGVKSVEGHFHKGATPTKNPEQLLVARGSIVMNFEDIRGNKKKIILEAGNQIKIPPYILHSYEVLEDASLIELRSEKFSPETADTYTESEFKKLQSKNHD